MKKVFKTHINFGSYIWGIVVIIFIGVLLFEALEKERYIGTLLFFLSENFVSSIALACY